LGGDSRILDKLAMNGMKLLGAYRCYQSHRHAKP
jgi:hypothetical protein